MRLGVMTLVVILLFLASCSQPIPETKPEPQIIRGEVTVQEPPVEEQEPLRMPELPYIMSFNTSDIPTMRFSLGKGDQFAARIHINPRGNWLEGTSVAQEVGDSVIFWVRDPHYSHIVDPGTISGVYEFTFIAEESGQYVMTFDDARGWVEVDMEHNFGETFAK